MAARRLSNTCMADSCEIESYLRHALFLLVDCMRPTGANLQFRTCNMLCSSGEQRSISAPRSMESSSIAACVRHAPSRACQPRTTRSSAHCANTASASPVTSVVPAACWWLCKPAGPD